MSATQAGLSCAKVWLPPRVDYELTELGLSLTEPLSTLARWASDRRAEIEAARRHYETTHPVSA